MGRLLNKGFLVFVCLFALLTGCSKNTSTTDEQTKVDVAKQQQENLQKQQEELQKQQEALQQQQDEIKKQQEEQQKKQEQEQQQKQQEEQKRQQEEQQKQQEEQKRQEEELQRQQAVQAYKSFIYNYVVGDFNNFNKYAPKEISSGKTAVDTKLRVEAHKELVLKELSRAPVPQGAEEIKRAAQDVMAYIILFELSFTYNPNADPNEVYVNVITENTQTDYNNACKAEEKLINLLN